SGLAQLDDSLAITDASGLATAGHWRVLGASEQRLIGSVPATSLDSVRFDVIAVQSGTLEMSGWEQNRLFVTGTALETSPGVKVMSNGKPLAGVAVTFAITSGDGSPASTVSITNASGIAQGPAWTLGAAAGLQVMTATAPGFTPQSVAFHAFAVEALPAHIEMVAGDGQSAVILTPLAVDPAVKVTDGAGNPIVGFPVHFNPQQGTLADSTPVTNAAGIATGGHWTMPRGVSPSWSLWVESEDLEGSPVVFHAASLVGPPAAIHPSMTYLDGFVGGASGLPSILVVDAGSNAVEGVPVTTEVTIGHGTITHSGATNAQGSWVPTSWILDTIAGINEVTVTVAGFSPVKFTSIGYPGPAATMTSDGDLQSASIYSPVQVSVRLTDRYGNPTPHQPIQFVSSGDSRTLPANGQMGTDTNGVARISWRMGSSAGGYSLTATHATLPALTQAFTATATPVTSGFDIKIQYIGTPSAAMESAVAAAVARWRAIISNDLPDATLNRDAAECFDAQPAIAETVDDILIYIETDGIDGVGGILGAAGPCLIRSLSRLPSMGYMHLDVADVAQLAANGQLQDVVLHEMGHILGIGTLWADRNYVLNPGSSNPRYSGPMGVQGYRDLGGLSSTVPVENTGGTGTADAHWREETFGQELMTGYISNADNPLTRMTIGSLQDLGYTVSLTPSEPLVIPSSALAQLRTRPRRLIERTLPSPIVVLDQSGREVGRERRLR
ncbi:MAG TPA: leishmanolysin-related zinc metalloendopeptidase, partial [Gemmatimonadales bacterium]|nr:leishmanolysin-related zinc metalloendopeptidase [Gemmatimonadales bacterium]